jgi:hypothetical protein
MGSSFAYGLEHNHARLGQILYAQLGPYPISTVIPPRDAHLGQRHRLIALGLNLVKKLTNGNVECHFVRQQPWPA